MSNASLAESQLMELLLQLKKTTPDAAHKILSAQPQIGYALITLMVAMDAVNVDVVQKTVASFSQPSGAPNAVNLPVPTPAPALPSHLNVPSRSDTPSSNGYPVQTLVPQPPKPNYPSNPSSSSAYQRPPPTESMYGGHSQPASTYPPTTSAQPPAPALDILAAIPEDQKAVIMSVLAMTPENIARLPPSERANILQLRTTLGLPS